MPITITMPALSPTMTEGTLAKWHVKEGDQVSPGDVLAEIETDKATMEVEAIDDGVVGRLLVGEGTEAVAVNAPIAVLLEEGEDQAALEDFTPGGGDGRSRPQPREGGVPAAAQEEVGGIEKQGPTEPGARESAVALAPSPTPPEEEPGEAEIPAGTAMTTMTVRDALRDAMAEEMRRDDSVLLMGEEVGEYQGAYKVSQGLLAEFGPKRVIDTPITEHGFAGLGVGAAFARLKPIVEFMTFNFAMQAIDQIINSAAKTLYMSGGQMGCPMVFRGPNGAAARVAAQHSQDFASWYAHVPGLKVVAPYSAADAKGLLKAAVRDPNPVIFLEHEILYGRSFEVPELEDFVLPIGKARVARPGRDVTIAAYSISVGHALEAAETLAEEGIEAEVIDLRTLRPLDTATLVRSVRKTNRCVTVEEGWAAYGVGAELAAVLMEQAFDYLDAPVARVAHEDVPLPYAANLERLALPSAEKVAAAVRSVCYR